MTSRSAPWLEPTLRRYTIALALLTLAAAALLALLAAPEFSAQALIMAVAVALIALPHGAFDMEIGRRAFRPVQGRLWWIPFVALYLLGAVLAALLWWIAPTVGLALLLLLGALHWGDEDLEKKPPARAQRVWLALSRGAVPVALPCLAHPERVAEIFTILGVADATTGNVRTIAAIATVLALPGVLVGIFHALSSRRGAPPLPRAAPLLEVGAIAALMFTAPPLLAFTLYFCLWHSVRHSLRSASELDPDSLPGALRRYARATALPVGATIVAAAVVVALILRSDIEGVPAALVQAVFIGLFALTIPHVSLEWLVNRGSPAHEGLGGGSEPSSS